MGHVGVPEPELPEATLPEAGSKLERRQESGSGVGVDRAFEGEKEASTNALTGFEKLE